MDNCATIFVADFCEIFCFRRFPDVFPTSSRCRFCLVGPMASNRSWSDNDFTQSARYREIAVGPTEIYRPRRVPDRIGTKTASCRHRGVSWAVDSRTNTSPSICSFEYYFVNSRSKTTFSICSYGHYSVDRGSNT